MRSVLGLHLRCIRVVAACTSVLLIGGVVVLFVLGVMPPVRSFARLHEPLPTAVVEGGGVVYCRLRCCDFRFPLPPGAIVEHLDGVHGGFDTIDGSAHVAAVAGSSLDMRAYALLLEQHGFRAEAPDTCSLFASSTKPRGGSIQVSRATPAAATIQFSYFGDY